MSFKKEMCNSLYQTHTNVLSLINLARMSSTDTFKTDSQGLSQQCPTIKLIHTNGCIVSKPKGQRGHHMENCIFFFNDFYTNSWIFGVHAHPSHVKGNKWVFCQTAINEKCACQWWILQNYDNLHNSRPNTHFLTGLKSIYLYKQMMYLCLTIHASKITIKSLESMYVLN